MNYKILVHTVHEAFWAMSKEHDLLDIWGCALASSQYPSHSEVPRQLVSWTDCEEEGRSTIRLIAMSSHGILGHNHSLINCKHLTSLISSFQTYSVAQKEYYLLLSSLTYKQYTIVQWWCFHTLIFCAFSVLFSIKMYVHLY